MRAPVFGQHAEHTVEHRRIDIGPLPQLRVDALDRLAPTFDVSRVDGHRLQPGAREHFDGFAVVLAGFTIEPLNVAAHHLANDALVLGTECRVNALSIANTPIEY